MKNFYLTFIIACLTLCCVGCSKDDELSLDGEGTDTEISSDLFYGKIFYYANLSDLMKGRCLLETREPVELYTHNPGQLQLSLSEYRGKQYIQAAQPNSVIPKRVVIPAYIKAIDSDELRNIIFIIENDLEMPDLGERSGAEEGADTQTNELLPVYGKFLGQGTQCYRELGNVTQEILLYDMIKSSSQKGLFTNSTLSSVDFTSLHETSFSSLMTSLGVSVGLSAKKSGFGGGFSYGYSKSQRENNDYEYLMYNCLVKCAEMKINMSTLKNMTSDKGSERDAAEFLSYVTNQFNREILEVSGRAFNPDSVYAHFGTDVITQGTLGGTFSMIYSREENMHESTIKHDFAFHANHTQKEDTTGFHWYQYLREKSGDEDLKFDLKVSYQKSEYFSATKAKTEIYSRGGSITFNNPEKWVAAFNDQSQSEKWVLVQYNLRSDNPEGKASDEWHLYNIDLMAEDVVNAVEKIFDTYSMKSEADKNVIKNARANIARLNGARKYYIENNNIKDVDKRPLVVCDVMMKNCDQRRKGDLPQPFVAPDPMDKTKSRTYYPLITNPYFDPKKGKKKMRGMPIDTNDNVFVAANHTSSHYWYVALAHEGDCNGLIDIQFFTPSEARDKRRTSYIRRGDHARKGLGGLLVDERSVYVKFSPGPEDRGYNPKNLITAFGLYDTHDDYKDQFIFPETYRIFASSFGADIPSVYKDADLSAFRAFWSVPFIKGEYPFYSGGWGVFPHSFYVAYSRNPLPVSELSKLSDRNLPRWGGDTYFDDEEDE